MLERREMAIQNKNLKVSSRFSLAGDSDLADLGRTDLPRVVRRLRQVEQELRVYKSSYAELEGYAEELKKELEELRDAYDDFRAGYGHRRSK